VCTEQQSGRATRGGSTGATPRRVGPNVGNPEDHRTRGCPVNERRSKMEQPAATDDVAIGKAKKCMERWSRGMVYRVCEMRGDGWRGDCALVK